MICIQTESLVDGLLKFSSKAETGVTFTDLEEYLYKIKGALAKRKDFEDRYIAVRLNDNEIDRLISKYPKFFEKEFELIKKGSAYEHCNFSYLVGTKLQLILKEVAYSM